MKPLVEKTIRNVPLEALGIQVGTKARRNKGNIGMEDNGHREGAKA